MDVVVKGGVGGGVGLGDLWGRFNMSTWNISSVHDGQNWGQRGGVIKNALEAKYKQFHSLTGARFSGKSRDSSGSKEGVQM